MASKGLDKRVNYRRNKAWRTRSNKVKVVKTPGNRLLVQYRKKKVSAPTTPKYLGGKPLQGLKRIRPSRKATVSASAKKVSRPYGGVLSYDQVRERIVRAFLIEEQKIVKRVLKMKKPKEAAPVTDAAATEAKPAEKLPSVYKLFIEIGRTVTFRAGPLQGKLGVIYDIIDVHRVMVQGVEFERRQAHMTDLVLERPVVKITRGDSKEAILSAVQSQGTVAEFEKTPSHKRFVRSTRRAALTDFERFLTRKLKHDRATLVRAEYKTLSDAVKIPERAAKQKAAAKLAFNERYNRQQSYKNLSRKITKRNQAKKAYEARVAKKKEAAKAN